MVCPVCTIAVAAGVGVLREFGIDDAITGLWFGALIISSIAWMIDYLNRKNIHFLFRKILVIITFGLIFIWPLYYWDIMGRPENIMFGISWLDRLLFGTIIGGALFILAIVSNSYLKKINNGEVIIYYQKILIPLIYLIIASTILHLLIGMFAW